VRVPSVPGDHARRLEQRTGVEIPDGPERFSNRDGCSGGRSVRTENFGIDRERRNPVANAEKHEEIRVDPGWDRGPAKHVAVETDTQLRLDGEQEGARIEPLFGDPLGIPAVLTPASVGRALEGHR
jgi:hypothetical protein